MDPFLDAIAPIWAPHPGQREFLDATANVAVLACGRRWGKTDAAAVLILRQLRTQKPSRTLLVAPTLDQARLLFDRVVGLVRRCAHVLGWFGDVRISRRPHPVIEVGGHRVEARSGHIPQNLRGHEADLIVVDEAAHAKDDLVEDVLSPMLATTRGRMVLLSTPNGLGTFWKWFRLGRDGLGGAWARTSPSRENPLVAPEWLAAQREHLDERAYRTEYEAEFLQDAGAVFREEAIRDARIDDAAPRTPGPVAIGVDWARTGDHTAVVVVEGSRGGCTVEKSIRIGHREMERQVEDVAEIVRAHPGATVAADCTGIGVGATERLREVLRTVPVRPVHFTPKSKNDMISGLRMLFERATLRLRPDPLLETELNDYICKESASGVTYGPRRGHDDLVTALALATTLLPRNTAKTVYLC